MILFPKHHQQSARVKRVERRLSKAARRKLQLELVDVLCGEGYTLGQVSEYFGLHNQPHPVGVENVVKWFKERIAPERSKRINVSKPGGN